MASKMHAFSLACALVLLAGGAQACTQLLLGGAGSAYPDQVLSSRNMGFFMTEGLGFDLVSVPKGTRLTQMPINGTHASRAPTPTKYGFVCVGSKTKQMAATVASYTKDPSAAANYGGMCSDGLNDAGLSGEWVRQAQPPVAGCMATQRAPAASP